MPSELANIVVILAYPLSGGVAVTTPVIFSNVPGWGTASTDTPASIPATTTFDPTSLSIETKVWRQQADGLMVYGGEEQLQTLSVRLRNPPLIEVDGTYSHPLDTADGYDWNDAAAVIYHGQATVGTDGVPTSRVALAALTLWKTLVVEHLSVGWDDATLTLRWPATFSTEAAPFFFRGYGSAARSVIRRADHSALRSTGSFTWRITYFWGWSIPAGTASIMTSPLIRLSESASAAMLFELRNAAGTWQGFTPYAFPVPGGVFYHTAHITYSSSTTKARLYLDGVFEEEITITGGLYATAASADTVWDTVSSRDWTVAGAQHLNIVETDEWILADALRGVAWHADATMTLPFGEAVGSVAIDYADNQDAVVESASWDDTLEGDDSRGGWRPPAIVGNAFGVKLETLSPAFSRLTPGYCGYLRGQFLHVTEQGFRLKPRISDVATTRTINAARDTISLIPTNAYTMQFAVGQKLIRSPVGAAGNPTRFVVEAVLGDPVLGNAQYPTSIKTATDQTADETSSFNVQDDSDYDYQLLAVDVWRSIGGGPYVLLRFPAIVLAIQPAGDLQCSIARDTDDSGSAILNVGKYYGPYSDTAPTISHELAGGELWHHGWVVDGSSRYGGLIGQIALDSFSDDYGPMSVGFDSAGAVAVDGLRLEADVSDDFTISESMVYRITEMKPGVPKPKRVTVRYARAWGQPGSAAAVGATDQLARELQREWRWRSAGTSTRVGVWESSRMRAGDAQKQASVWLRLQGFRLFRVELYDPVPSATIIAATSKRFLQTTLSWNGSALWTTPRTCWTVGYRAGVSTLTLMVITEI